MEETTGLRDLTKLALYLGAIERASNEDWE